jgi:succinylglutamate desuccinylase
MCSPSNSAEFVGPKSIKMKSGIRIFEPMTDPTANQQAATREAIMEPRPTCLLLVAVLANQWLLCASSVRVAVVGGTHGNEYTGVWCIKTLALQTEMLQQKYPALNISTILANPEAYMANRRFIDTDLNREFTHEKLCMANDIAGDETTVEAARAQELNKILGSKCQSDEPDAYDVAIDLHSTTSNMGTTLIIAEGDPLMAQGAAYVALKCSDSKCLMHSIPDKGQRPNLSSAATHSFTIEVGPVPQGLLRHDAVLQTECALHGLLEFLQRHDAGEDLTSVLQQAYPSGLVPAYRTAPATRPGEMSGKISWPSDDENPNFPQLMIHESLQDRDYQLLRKGDPIFVALDGSIVYYDGSHGDEVNVMFVNEGGYYYPSSGTGISVAIQVQFHLESGTFAENATLTEVPPGDAASQEL